MRVHNNTIRKYVQALLDVLNDFEVQYITTDEKVVNKKVPIVYGTREKQHMLDFVEQQFLESGNYSTLPRSYLRLVQLSKTEERLPNKLLKTNINIQGDYQEFIFSPMPYEFIFEYSLVCRGMNEASQLIEAIQTKFNPSLEIDIWDQQNMNTPTRIPVRLLDIQIDADDYTEESMNIISIDCSLQLNGNLYQPNDVNNKFSNPELEPCDDLCEGDCPNCRLPKINTRIMPVIKQVGYTLRASSDPQNKVTDAFARIDLFDVDESGHIILSCERPYAYSTKMREMTQDIERILHKKEVLDGISAGSLDCVEDIGKYYDDEDMLQREIIDYINKSKKEIFDMKSNINSGTSSDHVDLVYKLEKIIWGYDNNVETLVKILSLLKNYFEVKVN